jgi:hypothetical protein
MGVKLSLSYWEEDRVRVFVNRVLKNIMGLHRDELTPNWRKMHNQELLSCNLTK